MSDVSIKRAGNGKRVGAFAIDVLLGVVLGFLIFFFLGEQVIMENGHYFENASNAYKMLGDAGLADLKEDESNPELYSGLTYHVPGTGSKYNQINDDGTFGYLNYESDLVYFFSTFMPKAKELGYSIEENEKYNLAYFNSEWLGLNLTADANGSYGNAYYQPGKDEHDELSLSVRPVLRQEVAEALTKDETKKETASKLYALYYQDSDQSTFYYKAVLLVVQSESYQQFVGDANEVFFYAQIPTFLIPAILFFVVVPLCMKNGETIGKKILGLGLMHKDGGQANKIQVLLHYLIFVGICALLMIPSYAHFIRMAVMLFLAVDYMLMVMHPSNQALEDRLAKTVVADLRSANVTLQTEIAKESGETDSAVVEVEAKDKEVE